MPNYCNNTLELNGSYHDLNRFWNKKCKFPKIDFF